MNVDELTTELEQLSTKELFKLSDICFDLAKHKRNWESKKILSKLETGQRVKVKSSKNQKDFLGTISNIKKTNVTIQQDGSYKLWDVPGYMVEVIGDNDG